MAVSYISGIQPNGGSPFAGGVNNSPGTAQIWVLDFTGTYVTGDQYSVILEDSLSGLQTLVGAGNATAVVPTFVQTYSNKVYALGGNSVYFSAINSPTVFNDPNGSGNGFVQLNNWYSTPEPIVSIAAYQGYLAFFARRTIQIWQVDANPNNWNINQVLTNIGTIAPLSVAQLGNLDVIFLSDTGYRSLRAENITLAAFINDLGSPIDQIIQTSLLAGTPTTNAAACSVVEPLTTRYWSYLNGVIYVISYFPSNKIQAWSTYTPVDNTGNIMNIVGMLQYQGQVWLYGTDYNGNKAAWQYGGTNNNTFDNTKAKWQTGFFDAKTPGTLKQMSGVDIAVNAPQGGVPITLPDNWQVFVSADEKSAGNPVALGGTNAMFTQVYKGTTSSFDLGSSPYSDQGSHFSVYAESQGDGNNGAGGPATFNLFILHQQAENENN